jgi:hypothetical protein
MTEEGVAMKERRIRQPGLFDPSIPQVELPTTRRTETLVLLGTLLAEAIAVHDEAMLTQPQEVSNDQDHG